MKQGPNFLFQISSTAVLSTNEKSDLTPLLVSSARLFHQGKDLGLLRSPLNPTHLEQSLAEREWVLVNTYWQVSCSTCHCVCVCVFREHSASHHSLMSSCSHRALGHTPSGGCHLTSGSVHPHRVFTFFYFPLFYQKCLCLTESRSQRRIETLPLSVLSLSIVPAASQIFFSDRLFWFHFKKFLLGLKGEGEGPVMLTPEPRTLCGYPLS